jgi:hypothetical protein
MIGALSDFAWGLGTGVTPYFFFAAYSCRFAEPLRRQKPKVSFWRLLGKICIQDISILALALILATSLSWAPWITVAGWLGAGVAGIAVLALFSLWDAKKQTGKMRDYWKSVHLMQALAILAMTGLGCLFIGYEHPWISTLLSASALFIALSACIYFKTPPSGLEQPA